MRLPFLFDAAEAALNQAASFFAARLRSVSFR